MIQLIDHIAQLITLVARKLQNLFANYMQNRNHNYTCMQYKMRKKCTTTFYCTICNEYSSPEDAIIFANDERICLYKICVVDYYVT